MHLELFSRTSDSSDTNPHPTPLLFVHGAWHSGWCWTEYFLPYYAEHGYSTYAFDMRGHGKSDGAKGLRWTSIINYVDERNL